ncbi:MAG: DUF1989 domain-containing protein [Pseudomonadota bacterium]
MAKGHPVEGSAQLSPPTGPRYRGLRRATTARIDVGLGEAGSIFAPKGALISLTDTCGGAPAVLTAMGAEEAGFSTTALDLPPGTPVVPCPTRFDAREMRARAAARGTVLGDVTGIAPFGPGAAPGTRVFFKARDACHLFLILPVAEGYLSSGGGARVTVEVQAPPGTPSEALLPGPLGPVRDEWRVPRGTALAYELKRGEFVQIIDVDGQQCSDFMALSARALDAGVERPIDSTVSRTMTRSAYPLPGLHDKFFDQDMTPLLAVRQDTVGRHDTFALACTARGYEERGFPGHVNCSDNISDAFAPYSIARRRAWPAINFFFNSWIDWADHAISVDEAWSRPGDYVAMEALSDLVAVSTACPDDVDPINGWNPTDIHVRIYTPEAKLTHAVAWRAEPEEAARLTTHSAFHPCTSQLTSSYLAARDLWVPSAYDATGAIAEYWACRTAATLQDMSGLRKFDIVGPDAQTLLQHCMTRDVAKLSIHRGAYALMCDATGSVLDDGTLFRLEQTAFRWFCGSDHSALHLREQADALGLNARVLDLGARMVNLALQGPRARDILRQVIFTQPTRPALDNLKWFGFTIARLDDRDGPALMLCRSGFTGELGYELFCDREDATALWDRLMEVGAPLGLTPMGGDALEMLRIEAGLMSAGAEFGPDCDAYEAGLGFAVDLAKPDFLGKAALARNAAAPRRALKGLLLHGAEPPRHGDGVFQGRVQVGVITSASASPQFGHAIAMARLAIEVAEPGTPLEVGTLDGHMKRLPATVTPLPFLDPKREKARA